MVSILTLGNPRDLRLFWALEGLLASRGPVLALCREGVWLPRQAPSFLLADRGLSGGVRGRALVAVKDAALLPPFLEAEAGSLAILCSHNPRAVGLVARSGLEAVTCGLSPRDTVTFSSREKDRGTVAFQRPLGFPGAAAVEPGEFPIRFPSSWDPYTVLCCAAVAALLGWGDRELALAAGGFFHGDFASDPRKN